jgi:microcystin-dependent protein
MAQWIHTYPTFGGISVAAGVRVDVAQSRIENVGMPQNDLDACSRIYVRSHVLEVGDLKYSIKSADSNGWLLCDGRALGKTAYPELFAIIGTAFGSTDDDSFSLPDCRGRVMAAASNAHARGQYAGAESHAISVPELPAHAHTGATASAGTHNHAGVTGTDGAHTHTSNAIGGQGNLGLCLSDGTQTVTDTDETQGELNVWTTPRALTINSAGAHTHAVSSDGSHTHNFTSDNTGGGQAVSLLQPTIYVGNVFIYAQTTPPPGYAPPPTFQPYVD